MKHSAFLLVLVLTPTWALSQNCDNGRMSAPEMNDCADAYYTQQDKRLNYRYKQVMSALSKADKQAFKKQQIAWIKKKEKSCDKAGGDATTTGYGYRWSMCAAKMTKSRADEFESWWNSGALNGN